MRYFAIASEICAWVETAITWNDFHKHKKFRFLFRYIHSCLLFVDWLVFSLLLLRLMYWIHVTSAYACDLLWNSSSVLWIVEKNPLADWPYQFFTTHNQYIRGLFISPMFPHFAITFEKNSTFGKKFNCHDLINFFSYLSIFCPFRWFNKHAIEFDSNLRSKSIQIS